MPDLLCLENLLLPKNPAIDVRIRDIRIDIEPSEIFLLPKIHIDADLDIRIGF